MRVPLVLELVRDQLGGHIFTEPYSANLVVQRGEGGPGDWDGGLSLCWWSGDTWESHFWPCATRPGLPFLRSPINPKGTATIACGQYLQSHELGKHHGRSAIVQVAGAVVRVLRDPDHDRRYEPEVADTGDGLNIHDVESPHQLAGCVGLQLVHQRQLLYRLRLLQSHAPILNRRVSLSVVAG